MISATGIQDQEFAVGSVGRSVNNPAVARRRDLGTRPGCDRNPPFGTSVAVRSAEIARFDPVDGNRQHALGGRKSDRRGEPAGILEGRKIRPGVAQGAALLGTTRRARCAVEPALEPADQIFEIIGLARQLGGALALRFELLFGLALVLLPLVDQQGHAILLDRQRHEIAGQAVPLGRRLRAHAHQIAQFAGQRLGLDPHLRHDRAQQHGGAHRFERVLRLHHQGRRQAPADALEGGKHFDDDGTAAVERLADRRFAVDQLLQAGFGARNPALDRPDAGGGVDQRLIELAAILADRIDLVAQRLLALERLPLLGANRIEFLVALPDVVEGGLLRRCRADRQRERTRRHHGEQLSRAGGMANGAGHMTQMTCSSP